MSEPTSRHIHLFYLDEDSVLLIYDMDLNESTISYRVRFSDGFDTGLQVERYVVGDEAIVFGEIELPVDIVRTVVQNLLAE